MEETSSPEFNEGTATMEALGYQQGENMKAPV
jgi:hypothetical protein